MDTQANKKSEPVNTELRYKQLQDFSTEVNWGELVDLIVHFYVESGIGKLKVTVETMIRVYFLQLRYNLNATEVSLALNKINVLRDFALIDLKTDVLPEEDNIDSFRFLIERNRLTEQFSSAFNIQQIRQIATEV